MNKQQRHILYLLLLIFGRTKENVRMWLHSYNNYFNTMPLELYINPLKQKELLAYLEHWYFDCGWN